MIIHRIINMWALEELKFETNEELDEFHRALGRMVAYGLPNNIDSREGSMTQVVNLSIDKDKEITGAYFPAQDSLYREHVMSDALKEYQEGRPFVIGGILRDGKYSFHS